MEFNVGNLPFWYEPLKEWTTNPSLPLSRLVYWSFSSPLQDINEDMMICSVPLIDVNGNFLGVCGFEISAMNFMLRYEPRIIDSFHNIIFSFSSAFGSQLFLGEALFSGNNAVYNSFPKQGRMNRTVSINSFVAYELGGKNYIGMERPVRLYPDDSPFMRSAYLAAMLIPEADFYAMRKLARLRLGLLLFLLTAIGVAASILLSRRFTKPIIEKLNEAGESSLPTVRTNITEIDILLERLSVKGSPLPKNLFDDFLAKVKTLTPTELVVFQAHAEGKSLDRMAKNMFISANTLKTHNKHIYEKLEVSSKEELRLYISLLEKCGMMERIFSDSKADG
jgi:DNA-binding CsgD family transcriptional regulator